MKCSTKYKRNCNGHLKSTIASFGDFNARISAISYYGTRFNFAQLFASNQTAIQLQKNLRFIRISTGNYKVNSLLMRLCRKQRLVANVDNTQGQIS